MGASPGSRHAPEKLASLLTRRFRFPEHTGTGLGQTRNAKKKKKQKEERKKKKVRRVSARIKEESRGPNQPVKLVKVKQGMF